MVQDAQQLIGLEFSDAKIDLMLPGLKNQRQDFEAIHKFPISNSVPPALLFNPLPVGFQFDRSPSKFKLTFPRKVALPGNPEDLAFYSIRELAPLIKSRKITSEKLTRLYLDRLKKYAPRLECIVTLMEDRALEQARRADASVPAYARRRGRW